MTTICKTVPCEFPSDCFIRSDSCTLNETHPHHLLPINKKCFMKRNNWNNYVFSLRNIDIKTHPNPNIVRADSFSFCSPWPSNVIDLVVYEIRSDFFCSQDSMFLLLLSTVCLLKLLCASHTLLLKKFNCTWCYYWFHVTSGQCLAGTNLSIL